MEMRADRSGLTPTRAARIVAHYFVRTDAGIGLTGLAGIVALRGYGRRGPGWFGCPVPIERGVTGNG